MPPIFKVPLYLIAYIFGVLVGVAVCLIEFEITLAFYDYFYVDLNDIAANNPPVQPSLNDSAALNSSFQCPHCHSLCTAESQVDQRYVKELETELHKAETELRKTEAKHVSWRNSVALFGIIAVSWIFVVGFMLGGGDQ